MYFKKRSVREGVKMLFFAVIVFFMLAILAFLAVFINVAGRLLIVFVFLMGALLVGLIRLYCQLRDFAIKTKEMGW